MLAPDLGTGIERLQELIGAARRVLPFTGAGISTESGIPDFRSPGGIWTKNRPIPFDEFMTSREMRDEAWRRRFAIDAQFQAARPARGHRALASLYRMGKVEGIITQNIDNLHQESGIDPAGIVELHGNTTYATCLRCGDRYTIGWMKRSFDETGSAADCPACGGFIKTATISFGQTMPKEAMQQAEQLTRACDLFLVVGSSLVVWPAAGFPLMAKQCGARLIIINREATEFDDIADLVVQHDIGDTLAPFVAQ